MYDKLSYEYHEINSELFALQSQVSQLGHENQSLLIIIDENKHKEKVDNDQFALAAQEALREEKMDRCGFTPADIGFANSKECRLGIVISKD